MSEDELKGVVADAAPAAEQEATSEPQYEPHIVEQAAKYGWKPKAEWTGDAERWSDPGRFLASPITQTRILRDELKVRDERIAGTERAAKAALDSVRRQERDRFETELTNIRQGMRQAAETGDVQTYDALQEREKSLRAHPAEPQQQPMHPDAAAYVASPQGWWTHDDELATFAAKVVNASPEALALGPKKQFEWAEKKVREYYGERFPQETQAPGLSKVDGGGLAPIKRGRTISDLPADAQAAFKMFKKEGVKITEAEYVRQYLGEA